MKRHSIVLTVVVLLLASLAAPALASKAKEAKHGGKPLVATLTGAAERPGPGDPDGSGSALITLNYGQRQVCWELTHKDIDPPHAAHIHRAPATDPGPVVVTLDANEPGCVSADGALIKAIRADPSAYYVNIHNTPYPGGAIRGQLSDR